MNDDGSFNLLVGATDLGTGSDTVLAQMAAEVLGVPTDDILVYSSDTDFTPFDKGSLRIQHDLYLWAAAVKAARRWLNASRARRQYIQQPGRRAEQTWFEPAQP
jgi:putative selenate reductase molybdopterin-binding subunit